MYDYTLQLNVYTLVSIHAYTLILNVYIVIYMHAYTLNNMNAYTLMSMHAYMMISLHPYTMLKCMLTRYNGGMITCCNRNRNQAFYRVNILENY